MPFYKTIYTLEVLSEDVIPDDLDLEGLAYETDQGAYVGRLLPPVITELTGKQMADALYAFGSDPSFFHLTDDGEAD